MQKVITVTFANSIVQGKKHYSNEIPEIKECLEDGYVVKDVIPFSPPGASSTYSLTFILEKKDKK